MPVVLAYAYTNAEWIPSVVIEEEKGGYDMMKYLLPWDTGEIGIIGGRADNIHTQKRLLGIQKAMFEEQVPIIRAGSVTEPGIGNQDMNRQGRLWMRACRRSSVWRTAWRAVFMITWRSMG